MGHATGGTPSLGPSIPGATACWRGHGGVRRIPSRLGGPAMSAARVTNEKILDKATARTYMLVVSLVKVVSNPNGGDALG